MADYQPDKIELLWLEAMKETLTQTPLSAEKLQVLLLINPWLEVSQKDFALACFNSVAEREGVH